MSDNTTVIQTTAFDHGRRGGALIDADLAFRRVEGSMTEDQLVGYEMAAFLYWNHATNAILREGKCRFERED